jgi:hypothetical protein
MRTSKLLSLSVALLFAAACGSDTNLNDRTDTQDDPIEDTGVPITDGPQPDIKVDPETLGFGYRPPGCASAPSPVTITNVGEAALDIRSIAFAGSSAYTFVDPTAVQNAPDLQPLQEFTFQVKFNPSSMGLNPGSLEIRSNDPDENLVTVELVGEGSNNEMGEDIFTQAQPSAVDVLWVIDNSGSMSDIITDVGNNLTNMTQNFQLLGLDYQLGVVTTDMDNANDQGKLRGDRIFSLDRQGTNQGVIDAFKLAIPPDAGGSADERGRDAAYAALTNPLLTGHNAGFIRPDANLSIIVVSDEDDSSSNISKPNFISWLNAFKGDPDKTSFSGMVGPRGGGGVFPTGPCGIMPAPAYNDVIDGTGGLHTDLCQQNFDDVLTWLSYYAAGMRSEFNLSSTPANQFQIQVKVDGRSIPFFNPTAGQTGSWELLMGTSTIRLRGDAIPGPGEQVVVTYPVPSSCN